MNLLLAMSQRNPLRWRFQHLLTHIVSIYVCKMLIIDIAQNTNAWSGMALDCHAASTTLIHSVNIWDSSDGKSSHLDKVTRSMTRLWRYLFFISRDTNTNKILHASKDDVEKVTKSLLLSVWQEPTVLHLIAKPDYCRRPYNTPGQNITSRIHPAHNHRICIQPLHINIKYSRDLAASGNLNSNCWRGQAYS